MFVHHVPFTTDDDRERPGQCGCQGGDLIVGTGWCVMHENQPPGAGRLGQTQHGASRRMAVVVSPILLGLVEHASVEKDVDAASKGQTGAAGRRPVVRQVGQAGTVGLDAIAEGATTLVRHLRRGDRKTAERMHAGVQRPEEPTARRPSGRIGKGGGDMQPASRALADPGRDGEASPWAGSRRRTWASGRSPAPKNGSPCMWSQCR